MLVYVPGAWSGERLPDVVWWYARLSVSPRMALLVTVGCSGLSVPIAGHLPVTARVVNGQGLLGLATHCTLRHQDTLMRAPLLAGMSLRRGMRPMLVYVPGAWSGERLPE